jgi:hypothetical protein
VLALGGSNAVQIAESESKLLERYIAALFYFATDGDNWEDQTKWLSKDSTCDWYGVFCSDWGGISEINLGESFRFSSFWQFTDYFLFFSR